MQVCMYVCICLSMYVYVCWYENAQTLIYMPILKREYNLCIVYFLRN